MLGAEFTDSPTADTHACMQQEMCSCDPCMQHEYFPVIHACNKNAFVYVVHENSLGISLNERINCA
jgi:hypothetical protein